MMLSLISIVNCYQCYQFLVCKVIYGHENQLGWNGKL